MRSHRVLLLLLGALVTAFGVLPAAVAAPAAPVPAGVDDITLEITEITPTVLRPDGTLTVRGRLRNAGDAPARDLSVRLVAWTPRLTTRDAVHDWAQGRSGVLAGNQFLDDLAVPELAAGASTEVTLTAPAAELGLPATAGAWGPRGVTLDVIGPGSTQLVADRGFTVWDPRPPQAPTGAPPVSVSVLAPLTAGPPAVATGVVPPARMAELTADGGRLARVLAAASHPEVAWALDPAVLASAAAPDGPAGWLSALRDAARGRDVLALPQADPDLTAVTHAGTPELYRMASLQGRRTVTDLLDVPALPDLAWPAAGTADPASLAMAADAGAQTIVLSAGAQPPVGQTGTLTGRSTVPAGDARLDGLLVDTRLSAALTAATQGEGTGAAVSRLLAETAVVARDTTDAPHLLLALPRDWDPDVDATRTALEALRAVPWARTAPVDELLDAEPDAVDRAPVRASGDDRAGELPADGLRAARQAVEDVRRVAGALTRPDEVLDAVERSAVAATSVGWRADLGAWRAALSGLQADVAAVRGAVHVVPGSAVNLVAAQADLPVSVANELSQAVRAVVEVRPANPRLVAEGPVTVDLPAESTTRVQLPVRAVANGDLEVVVTVRTPDGALLGEPVTVPVRVRADWETRGVLATGAVLAAVLVVGLVRTIRRGRRRADAADPLAAR